jgi:uncharacterized membrane protein YgcG
MLATGPIAVLMLLLLLLHLWSAAAASAAAADDRAGADEASEASAEDSVTAAREFFVDGVHGADSGPGSAAKPWKTIVFAATQAAAAAREAVAAPITVTLAAGVYTDPLFFGAAQSGTPTAPITFRGAAGAAGGAAVISGGVSIPNSALRPSPLHHTLPAGLKVLSVDLAALGVNISDLGSLAPGTLGECSGSQMELVEDGKVMTLARWPNANSSNSSSSRSSGSSSGGGGGGSGSSRATAADNDVDDGYPGLNNWGNIRKVWGMGGGTPQAFTLLPNRSSDHRPPSCPGRPHAACPTMGPVPSMGQIKAWAKEADAGTLWFHGYWQNDWGDSYVKAAAIDVTTGRVNISRDTGPCYPVTVHARVMVVNSLSELDAPGEYYISPTGILYLIPTAATAALAADHSAGGGSGSSGAPAAPAYVLTARRVTGCVLCAVGASHLSFENLEIGYSRGTPVSVVDSNYVSFRNVTVRAAGGYGMTVQGGSNCEVLDSEISGVGCRALDIIGGNTASLTPANHSIRGNLIHNYARLHRTYNPGISWGGVGNHFIGNTIRDAPHAAILGGGVLNTFEHNTIERVAYEVDDAGAFYTGRSWVERGNVVQHNQ